MNSVFLTDMPRLQRQSTIDKRRAFRTRGLCGHRSRGRAEIRIRLATEFAASPVAKRKDHILNDDQRSVVDRFKSKFQLFGKQRLVGVSQAPGRIALVQSCSAMFAERAMGTLDNRETKKHVHCQEFWSESLFFYAIIHQSRLQRGPIDRFENLERFSMLTHRP